MGELRGGMRGMRGLVSGGCHGDVTWCHGDVMFHGCCHDFMLLWPAQTPSFLLHLKKELFAVAREVAAEVLSWICHHDTTSLPHRAGAAGEEEDGA